MALAVPALAGGITAEKLEKAGSFCFDPGTNRIHCVDPADSAEDGLLPRGAAINVMVFDSEGEIFLGTEVLRITSQDLSGLPCPGQDDGTWDEVAPDLWACHHWSGAPGS